MTDNSTKCIAVVVPILNEALGLPSLLSAISSQTRRPDEIIFIDAGSTDSSREIIANWWQHNCWPSGSCHVVVNLGGYPGHNRNMGINMATCEWIAFIDGGINPENDWLEKLYQHTLVTGSKAVFGVCDFCGENEISTAVCALSYGVGTKRPVLPASLFHKDVFQICGHFDETLRAAEDIKWIASLEQRLGRKVVCNDALVHYSTFPDSLSAVARKYFMYQRHVVKAGFGKRSQILYVSLALASLLVFAIRPSTMIWLIGGYCVFRGVLDPIRRSNTRNWWRAHTASLAIVPLVAATIDIAKLFGILYAGVWQQEKLVGGRKLG